jgi:hypothetical protein
MLSFKQGLSFPRLERRNCMHDPLTADTVKEAGKHMTSGDSYAYSKTVLLMMDHIAGPEVDIP